MNQRSVERVLAAASAVQVADAREAAILGGVVRSLLNDGKLSMQFIRHAAKAAMDWHAVDHVWGAPQLQDRAYPTDVEIKRMAALFRAKYGGPEEETAAA